MNNTVKILSIIILINSFYGCLSNKRLAKFVNQKYDKESYITTQNDYIDYDTNKCNYSDTTIKVTKLKSYFIPALIYWEWNNTMKCQISNKQTFENFKKYFEFYADSLNIKEKLNGNKLTIRVDSIPKTFVFSNKGDFTFLLFILVYKDLEVIYPDKEKFVISY